MAHRTLKFKMSSYWHAGSGAGSEAVADAVVLRDRHGLPTLPGRTIKGLLRDAMHLATLSGTVAPERWQRWFGSPLPGQADGEALPQDGDEQEVLLEQGRFSTHEGLLWFGSAHLPKAWRDWADQTPDDERKPTVDALFTHLASTAIDEKGIAKEHTLRVIEVAVPMELQAEVHGPDDDTQWVKDLEASLPLLRALGSRRQRGLGRVDVSLEEKKK